MFYILDKYDLITITVIPTVNLICKYSRPTNWVSIPVLHTQKDIVRG